MALPGGGDFSRNVCSARDGQVADLISRVERTRRWGRVAGDCLDMLPLVFRGWGVEVSPCREAAADPLV